MVGHGPVGFQAKLWSLLEPIKQHPLLSFILHLNLLYEERAGLHHSRRVWSQNKPVFAVATIAEGHSRCSSKFKEEEKGNDEKGNVFESKERRKDRVTCPRSKQEEGEGLEHTCAGLGEEVRGGCGRGDKAASEVLEIASWRGSGGGENGELKGREKGCRKA